MSDHDVNRAQNNAQDAKADLREARQAGDPDELQDAREDARDEKQDLREERRDKRA